jgi:hypothetical protein
MQFVRRPVQIAILLLLASVATAPAQEWAKKMFTTTSHDFGNVARGGKAQFKFSFKNIYEEPVHVASVRSSCSCTLPEASKSDLKTWETSDIVANFNTNAFLGSHSATITVTFDKPYLAEVQLQVNGNIRSDVVLQPGSVELGTVDVGQGAEKRVSITRTGRADWTISDVRSANTNFEVEVQEQQRTAANVTYDLTVRLKPTAPVGYINDQLVLVTNDTEASQIPVDVEGRVVADVTATPMSLSLGALAPGQSITKNIVVRSKRPLKITGVACDPSFSFKLPEAANEIQVIQITFTAGQQPGKFVKKLKIKSDLGENAVPEITCQGSVVDPNGETPAAAPAPAPATASGPSGNSTARGPTGPTSFLTPLKRLATGNF